MLDSLITSKTRVKLLLKFFFNPETKGYLRGLAAEFGESTNAVRVELNRLTEAGLLQVKEEGRTKLYQANQKHSLFQDLQNIVRKYIGIDHLIDQIIHKLGNVQLALITGDYARGIDSGIIDLVIVGEIDRAYLQRLVSKAEDVIGRKIRTLVLTEEEFRKLQQKIEEDKAFIVWDGRGVKGVSESKEDD